jgi:putative glycosyltransferase (TIGR04348 family)
MNLCKPVICLVTPAMASANNGNWQTAQRWARMLAADYEVRLVHAWEGQPADAMLALHARRSAPSIAAWAASTPRKPLAVVLTGTDLYRDIHSDAAARRSLALADRLVVLHEGAPADLPAEHRGKCVVCFQSTAARRTLPKTRHCLRALMVGHLREEKDPRSYFAAARLLAGRGDILLDHIGAPLDAALGNEARALAATHPHYRWLGGLAHVATLARIQRAHVLVHASAMEGGAHVVMEAVRCGTPVLASRISGNVGMLGRNYKGYFEPSDAQGLAGLLSRCRDDAAMLPPLQAQCAARAPLFEPARERETLRKLLRELLESPRDPP